MSDLPDQIKQIYQRLSNFAVSMTDRAKMREHSFVLTVAIIIGLLGGFGAVGIQYAIKEFQQLFWGGEFDLSTLASVAWWQKILIPALGGIFVGLIIQYVAKEAKGHGVPEVMEAITLRNGVIRPRVVLAKLFASAVYIASGGSVGREGPVIQIGSAIGSTVGQFFRVNPKRMRVFVACGAASGIAAAFNAPVAGALFAVEVILGDFAVAQFSPIVISSVAATVVSRHYLGDFPAFVVPKYHLGDPTELLFYAVLGVLAAGSALLFIKVLYSSEEFFDNLKWPEYVKAGIGGAGIGLVGLFFPQIFGVGYDTIDNALNNTLIWQLALALVFLKVMATSLSLGSGGSGGIFAPSLFIGAMLGSFFGSAMSQLFPEMGIVPGAYALVAMGGVVAAATHGPIAAILIIFEMSNDYKIILPLMITCIIATVLAMRLREESIYTLKLKLRGINIFGGREVNVLKSLHVRNNYNKSVVVIPESEPFIAILRQMSDSAHTHFYVADKEQKITGVISLNDLRQTILDYEHLKNILIAADIMNPRVIFVTLDETLDEVMRKFGQTNLEELPVVASLDNHEIAGSIQQNDVIELYNRQIFLRDMSGELSSTLNQKGQQAKAHVFDQYHLLETEAPTVFLGKSLRELNLRNNYHVDALLVKKNVRPGQPESLQPGGDYRIEMGDVLLLFGDKASLERIEKL